MILFIMVVKEKKFMKIALIQIKSVLDPEKNLSKINSYLKQAVKKKAVAAFLPEVFYSMSDGLGATPYLVTQENDHYQVIKKLAVDNGIAILGGTAATKVGNQVVNRSYNFSKNGTLLGIYDKINMFKCLITKNGKNIDIDEKRVYTPGSRLSLIEFEQTQIGLSTCFDLRYPQIYQDYKMKGAKIITASSAFTQTTGKDHWHILVRARAIESQCFMIASNQTGKHNEKMTSYGHSLVVDPWGRVLVDLKKPEGMAVVNLDLSLIDLVRSRIIL